MATNVDLNRQELPTDSDTAGWQESALSQRLMAVLEAEREKIARELHDEAGQLLISAAFNLDQALAMLPQAFVARRLIEQARQALDECADELHRLAFNLRPRMLDDLGLIPALRSYLKRYAGLDEVDLDVELELPGGKLPAPVELAIFRIVQEAVVNIRKHSRATAVRIRLSFVAGCANLEIADDGVGFDVAAVDSKQDGRPTLGLGGMCERARALGGELQVESSPLSGTVIRAILPVGDEGDASSTQRGR